MVTKSALLSPILVKNMLVLRNREFADNVEKYVSTVTYKFDKTKPFLRQKNSIHKKKKIFFLNKKEINKVKKNTLWSSRGTTLS